jgi:HD superfamily phosphohydrolase/tRNA A-37 threonylcarbamoyl transferase component Bud32
METPKTPSFSWPLESLLTEIEEHYSKEKIHDAWTQESSNVEKSLRALNSKLGKRFSPALTKPVLGLGGSGIVLQLVDSKFVGVDVALKFPRPVTNKISLLAEMLQKEIAQLARLRHPGIVRIIFYDTVDLEPQDKSQIPFYIMELVDGKKSYSFTHNPNIDERQFLHLLKETIKVVTYLHNHTPKAIVHLDIKPDNIVVSSQGNPVMIDLGTCKQLSSEEDKTIIACTRSYAHPKLAQRLAKDPSDENRSKGELKRSEIDPQWDLWAFGRTILVWMGINPEDGTLSQNAIFPRLKPYTRKYLLLLVARLHVDFPLEWLSRRIGINSSFLEHFRIENTNHLLDLVLRLDGSSNPLSEIPELTTSPLDTMQAASGQHVLNSERLETVLAHRLFRRLNSITQLGLVSLVYPGAKHTRREHSLGTYANTVKFLHTLYNDPVSPLFRQIIDAQDCRDILLAALLHDLGQFPLAHDLEEIDYDVFNHSDLTIAMLRSKWSKKKKGSKEINFESLEDVFREWDTTPDRIIDILSARPSSLSPHPKAKLLRSIINGPIDADKLDYLFRDARYLNLPYPLGTDVERLHRCLTTVIVEKVDSGAKNIPSVGIYAKGLVAAEFLSFSRYAMFSQAYWHHAVRAQKAMLFRAVTALVENCKGEEALNEMISSFYTLICDLPEILFVSPQTELFKEGTERHELAIYEQGRGTDLAATDAAVLSWFSEQLKKHELSEQKLIEGILKRTFFKRLWVVSHDDDEKRWRDIIEIWDDLKRDKHHKLGTAFEEAIAKLFVKKPKGTTELSPESAVDIIKQKTDAKQPWLLIDIPSGRPGSEIGLFCVRESQGRRLRKDDHVVGDIQMSGVWERYAKNLRKEAGKIRIFCDPDLVEVVDATIEQTTGLENLIDVLKELK